MSPNRKWRRVCQWQCWKQGTFYCFCLLLLWTRLKHTVTLHSACIGSRYTGEKFNLSQCGRVNIGVLLYGNCPLILDYSNSELTKASFWKGLALYNIKEQDLFDMNFSLSLNAYHSAYKENILSVRRMTPPPPPPPPLELRLL